MSLPLQSKVLLGLMFLLLWGCSNGPQKPEKLVEEYTYINLLVELQLVRSYAEATNMDSLATDSLARQVYQKYGTSQKTFRQSHQYYQQFPKQQKERIDQAIELLRKDQVQDTSRAGTPQKPQ